MGRGECKGGKKGKNVLAKTSGLCYTKQAEDLLFQGYLFSYINEKSQTADVPIENRMRCREADFRSLPEIEGVW